MSVSSPTRARRWRYAIAAIGAAALALVSVPAFADNIYQDIGANGTTTVTLSGSSVQTTVNYYLHSGGASACTASSSVDVIYDVVITGAGSDVSASPSKLDFTSCDTSIPVTFTATATGSWPVTLVEDATSEARANPANAALTLTVSAPAASNTKPSVAVSGFTNGDTYELGHDALPTPVCVVTDDHDVVAPFPATVTGTLDHGLGDQTATCDYTDKGGLAADTATATYTIVDTTDPTINHTLAPSAPDGNNGWYRQDVTVHFICDDAGGSGIQSCTANTTLGEGANQSVTGTATDWAGNTATDAVTGINVDETAPIGITFSGVHDYYWGDVQTTPTCDAIDDVSALASCVVTGGGVDNGTHTWTATATDNAGNTSTATQDYDVKAWTIDGFYSPVDMNSVLNTVKGGSTVPLKFEIFVGPTELTNIGSVKSFVTKGITCPDATTPTDDVEFAVTGGTSLRYDATAGQFIQNWKTPTAKGCYRATMTAQDGSAISADFKVK